MLLRARGLRCSFLHSTSLTMWSARTSRVPTFHPGSSTFNKHLGFLRLVGLSQVFQPAPDRPAPSRAPVLRRALFQIFGAATLPHTRSACYP
jgi:hypothetical protein